MHPDEYTKWAYECWYGKVFDMGAIAFYLAIDGSTHFFLGSARGLPAAEPERLELGPRDRARSIWLREIFSDGVPGDADSIRRLVACAGEAIQAGDADLPLKLLHAAALRCWWADPGDAARELVVATAQRSGVVPTDLRVVEILALAELVDSGVRVAELASAAVRDAPTSTQTADEARQLGFLRSHDW